MRIPGHGGLPRRGDHHRERRARRRRAAKDLPEYCRVAATLRPSADSDIKVEVWLPATGWNGKLLAVGNGGWNGTIDGGALADGLRRGYAVTATDRATRATGDPGCSGPRSSWTSGIAPCTR